MESLGVVHLRDLNDRNRWDTRKLSAYLDRLGLAERSGKAPPDQFSISAVAPPTRLIALNRADDVELLRKFRGWLGQAEELHLVVCYTGHPDEHDREQSEREASSALFPTLVAKIYHWGNHQEAPFGLSLILDTAKLAWPAPPALACSTPGPPGPWLDWPDPPGWEPELQWPRWVCRRDDAPSLYHPPSGRFLNLTNGFWSPQVAPPTEATFLCVAPDGTSLLSSDYRGDFSLLNLESGRLHTFRGPAGAPLGVWPNSQVGWAGHRCTFSWLYLTPTDGAALASCDHDWPCGHEKKQYGYLDNEPCWVHLSPLQDAYLSVYQKDAVVSQALPVGWSSFGETWAAVTEPAADRNRALFFTYETDNERGGPEEPEDGDARDLRPVIALGPDPTYRYTLDLRRTVYRIVGDSSTRVNEPMDGYAVYNDQHQPLRYGEGRLLGGWGRWLVGLSDGRLWREDTVSGERVDLGPVEREVLWAFPLPASGHLVLVGGTTDKAELRLI